MSQMKLGIRLMTIIAIIAIWCLVWQWVLAKTSYILFEVKNSPHKRKAGDMVFLLFSGVWIAVHILCLIVVIAWAWM